MRVTLKKSGHSFKVTQPQHQFHNFLLGKLKISTFGWLTLENLSTGTTAKIYFKPKKMNQNRDFGVEGSVVD